MKYYYQVEGGLRNNIGDVLQGMVAKPFLPDGALIADREALGDLDSINPGLLIANGWYMHSFDKFPPPENVNPIYVSVHIATSKLLAKKSVREHFKKHSPIGCRDDKTLKLFLGWGIPAYYSSCLTTTAKPRAKINNSGEGEVLLVDNVDHPIPENVKIKLEQLLNTSFTRISHDPPHPEGDFQDYAKSAEQLMDGLLARYCKAKLVVTTKIHCALPCLGMGAKVMMVHPNPDDPRVDTVREFLEIYSYDQVLKADTLKLPVVDNEKLKYRQNTLTRIVTESVAAGYNIMSKPKDADFKVVKAKGIRSAKFYRLAVYLMFKLGIKKEQIKKVYGSGF
jgi:hypothetical protein